MKDAKETAIKIYGEFKDEMYELVDGEEILVLKTPWKTNKIVVGMSTLVAMLLVDEAGFSGIQFHALGHGDSSWDVTVPEADFTDTILYNEYYRKSPDSIQYVDETGAPVVGSTNRILVTTTFDFGEGTGSVREHGIFAGNATVTLDSGVMLNTIRHKEIYKGATRKLIRRIRFTFG